MHSYALLCIHSELHSTFAFKCICMPPHIRCILSTRCILTHSHSYAFRRIQMHSPTHAFRCIHSHTHSLVYADAVVCIRVHSYAFACIRMHSYAFVHPCMHMHAFSCIRMHTRMHTTVEEHPAQLRVLGFVLGRAAPHTVLAT